MDEKGIELQEINTMKETNVNGNLNNNARSSSNNFLLINQKETESLKETLPNIRKASSIKDQKIIRNEDDKKGCVFTSFLSCLKYLVIIRERKLSVQVGIVYTFLILIFIIIIISIKIIQMNFLFETQADKNYYQSIVSEMIDIQRQVKIQIDTINNDEYVSILNENLYFMKLYTEELITINNFTSDIFRDNLYHFGKNYDNIEKNLNFTLNPNLSEMVEPNKSISNLIPFYYYLTPIIYQNYFSQGIPIVNFYFFGNLNEEPQNCSETFYFKYPLEEAYKGSDSLPKNNKIYDYILDPVTECSEIPNDINRTINWFYYLEKSKDPKFINLVKVNEDNEREDYIMFYYNFNISIVKNYSMTIAIKILKNNMTWPFIKLNEFNDTKNYDYFSLINFSEKLKHINITQFIDKKIYKYEYDIDDSNTIIFKTPKFIVDIFKYSMIPNSLLDPTDKEYDININSLLLKYDEMDSIKDNFNVNYHFKKDSRIYELIVFLNKFLLYREKYQNLTLKEQIKIQTEDEHLCNLKDYDEYYNYISQYYNCFNDYCFYNNCDMQDKFYIPPEKVRFMPNCYCIPLYCGDKFTFHTQFHKDMMKKLEIKDSNENYNNLNYTYVSDNYDEENEFSYNSIIDVYFNRKENYFKCKIPFYQKNKSNSTFNTKIFLNKLTYDQNINMLLFFLMNNQDIDEIIEIFKEKFNYTKNSIYGIYFLLMIFVSVILILFIIKQANNLTERMTKIKEIRSSIISSGNIENKKKEMNQNNNNKYPKESNEKPDLESFISNEFETEFLTNNNNNKQFENEKNKKNILEVDELDALINIINDNLNDFKIEFNVNENMNDSINAIKKQYNEIMKVNEYKNKLLPKNEDLINDYFDQNSSVIQTNSNLNSSSHKSIWNIYKNEKKTIKENNEVKKDSGDDLSLKIFYELLSLSTSEIDFSNIKTNFYYRDNNAPPLLNFEEAINKLSEGDVSGNGEITNQEKLQNAINYYYNQIHCYWKKQYDLQKKKDEI